MEWQHSLECTDYQLPTKNRHQLRTLYQEKMQPPYQGKPAEQRKK
jgi:hypothetical protein